MKPSLDWEDTCYETVTFYYKKEENYFVNEHGDIIYDIFRFISPGRVRLFKETHEPYYSLDRDYMLIYEFLYPEEN